MQDELLHDPRLSAAARLVGIELLRCVNRAVGYAWPGREFVAMQLAFTVPTVRNSVKDLERLGYFSVERNVDGRTSHYWPRFIERRGKKIFPSVRTRGEKRLPSGGEQIRPARGEENRPQSPLRTSNINPSSAEVPKNAQSSRRAEAFRVKYTELTARPGDEQVERRVSLQLGDDGNDVLSVLYSIDGGAPYFRLIAAGREGPLDTRELAAARAAYEAHGSNLPRRRAQGGRP